MNKYVLTVLYATLPKLEPSRVVVVLLLLLLAASAFVHDSRGSVFII
jgi:hypothetical protein